MSLTRSRWAAIGAAVAVTLGAGGLGLVHATNPSGATTFVPITPCRVADTRPEFNVGAKNTPLAAGATMTVPTRATLDDPNAGGACSGQIPVFATGVSLNVTAVNATEPTFLTIWAAGAAQPMASSLNPVPGAPPTPNAVATGVSDGGQFNVFNLQGSVDVLIDVNGYYTDHNHDDRYPTRAEVNTITRLTPFAGGFVAADGTLGRNVGVASAAWNATSEQYEIELDGVEYSNIEYATMVTPNCGGADASTNTLTQAGNNKLIVRIEVGTDLLGQCGFSFLVSKLPSGA